MTSGCTTIIVDVTDEDGLPIGRSVPVDVCYLLDVDKSYGADADGLRGECRTEIEILAHHIDAGHLPLLNSTQIAQALADADAIAVRRLGAL